MHHVKKHNYTIDLLLVSVEKNVLNKHNVCRDNGAHRAVVAYVNSRMTYAVARHVRGAIVMV